MSRSNVKRVQITSADLKSDFSNLCKMALNSNVIYSVTYYDKPVIFLSRECPDTVENSVCMTAKPTYYRENWGYVFNSIVELGVTAEINLGNSQYVYMYKNSSYRNIFYMSALDGWDIDAPSENKELMYSHPIVVLKQYADKCSELRDDAKSISLHQKILDEIVQSKDIKNAKEIFKTIESLKHMLDSVVNNIYQLEDFTRFQHARQNRKDISVTPEMIDFARNQINNQKKH